MWYTLTSKNALSKGFQILLALASTRAHCRRCSILLAGLHVVSLLNVVSLTPDVGRSNGSVSVTTYLHPALTNSFVISETKAHTDVATFY